MFEDDGFDIEINESLTEESDNIDLALFDEGFNGDLPKPEEKAEKVEQPAQEIESDVRVTFLESLAEQYGMDTTEYMEAVYEAQQQQELLTLMEQGVSEEVAFELLETRKEKAKYEAEKQAHLQQQEKQENQMLNDFLVYFEQSTGRPWDANTDDIPQQAWEAVKSGQPLKEAYKKHSLEDAFLAGFNSAL